MKKIFLLGLMIFLFASVSNAIVVDLGSLTTPDITVSYNVKQNISHSFASTVASISNNVVMRYEGCLDGTNWFNLTAANTDQTITANGTFLTTYANLPTKWIRAKFVSESGATTATIRVYYAGQPAF